MQEVEIKNRQLEELLGVCNAIEQEDTDPLFGLLFATIAEECAPQARALQKQRKKIDENYIARDPTTKEKVRSPAGGFKIKDGKEEEYLDQVDRLLETGATVRCRKVRFSLLVREWERGTKIRGWMIRGLSPVLTVDIDLDAAIESMAAAEAKEAAEKPAAPEAAPEPVRPSARPRTRRSAASAA